MTNPYAPPRAAVKDVRDPHASAAPADRGTRLGASILDTIIFGAMVYLPLIVVAIFGPALAIAGGNRSGSTAGGVFLLLAGIVVIAGLGIWCWLTIRFVRENGQSIAKRMLGIKVVRCDGTPITLGRIFWMRNVLNTLIAVIPFYGIVDALFIFGESRQCLHDKLADTMVVKA